MCREVIQRCLIHRSSIAQSLSLYYSVLCFLVNIEHNKILQNEFPLFRLRKLSVSPRWYRGNHLTSCFHTTFRNNLSWKRSKHMQVISKYFYIVMKMYVALILLIKKHHTATKPQGFLIQLNLLLFFSCPAMKSYLNSVCSIVLFSPSSSVYLSLTLSLSLSPACALSFWTMTLRDSCNVRRLWILAGAWKAEAIGRERAFIWDWGCWPPSLPFSFLLLSRPVSMSASISSPHQQKARRSF